MLTETSRLYGGVLFSIARQGQAPQRLQVPDSGHRCHVDWGFLNPSRLPAQHPGTCLQQGAQLKQGYSGPSIEQEVRPELVPRGVEAVAPRQNYWI